MKLALIADIHGNLVALRTALADIERHSPDALVCLGDVASSGPRPVECIRQISRFGAVVVQGNSDGWLATPADLAGPSAPYEEVQDIDAWCRAKLGDTETALLRKYAPNIELPLGEQHRLFACHGSPRSFDEPMRSTTPADELSAILIGIDAHVVAAGHTHQAMVRRHERFLVVNPGSVGMPLEYQADGTVRNPPWTEYAMVSAHEGKLEVTLHRAPIDVQAVADDVHESGMPHTDWWLKGWFHSPT